jgi:hypothetical protein
MASRKMTFTLTEQLAAELTKRVPARNRSRFVVDAVSAKLRERDQLLIRACEIANGDPDVQMIEREFDSLSDDFLEPWTDAPSR